MSKQKYYDAKSLCPFGYYIGEEYVCIGCGEPCKLGMNPNKYICSDFTKYEKNYKTDQERGDRQWHQ